MANQPKPTADDIAKSLGGTVEPDDGFANPNYGEKDSPEIEHYEDANQELAFEQLLTGIDSGETLHIQDLDDLVKVDKAELMGLEFILTSWRFQTEGDYGEFAVCKITTRDNRHMLFIDGSTGIKDQLHRFEKSIGGVKPVHVPKGLRRSDYTYTDPLDGKSKPATTYYFDNASN